jgi:hypothetical protein
MEERSGTMKEGGGSGALVSVAVGNTTTRTVLWRSHLPPAAAAREQCAPEGRPLCTAETGALQRSDDDALCQFVATLCQRVQVHAALVHALVLPF